MIFRVLHNILIVCVTLGLQNNFFYKDSMTSANFHYSTSNPLVVPNSPYNQLSCQDSLTAVMQNMQNVVNSSQNQLYNNLIAVGDNGYLITSAVFFYIPKDPGKYGLPSISCTTETCGKARAILNNNSSTSLYSTFQQLPGLWPGPGQKYSAILLDTRNETWTYENTSSAVSFALSEVVPILSSFSQLTLIDVIFQDKVYASTLARTTLSCVVSKGVGFYVMNGQVPYRDSPYDNVPWRLLTEILLFFVNLVEIWFEVEDYKINTEQSRLSKRYFYSVWNWFDWIVEGTILIFSPILWIFNSKISSEGFGYEPVSSPETWYKLAGPVGIGFILWVFQYGLCVVFLVNLLRFFKVFRYHISLHIYLRFLKELFEMIGGFVSFFVVLVVQFALLFYILTSVSGFNSSFGTLSSSINEILQVTFDFVDYDSFTSNSFGLGNATVFVILFFYGAVIIFTVVMQNIVLAIIGNAHDVARRPENSASNIIFLLVVLILFHVITAIPIALLSLHSMLLCRSSQRVSSASKVLGIIDPFIAKYVSVIDPSWKKYSAFVRHDSLLKCLSFVYIDRLSDELKITHKGKVLNFAKHKNIRVHVNIELIGRAPWTDKSQKKMFTDISRVSRGTGTIEEVDVSTNEIVLVFESSDEYVSLDEQNTQSRYTQRFWLFSDSIDDEVPPKRVLDDHVSRGIFPAPSSAFHIFNETLSTSVELKNLMKVAIDEISLPGGLPLHPIYPNRPLLDMLDEGDISQAASDFFELFFQSEMSDYSVFKSDIGKSKQCTSVFEVVDDAIDSKRRFEQTYTGGFRNSVLFQKLDESNRVLLHEVSKLKDEINLLKASK